MKKYILKYNSLTPMTKASFWFLICSFLQKGISIITTPIFTRLMSTTEYGNYNIFNSWENLLIIFVTLNLYSGVYNQGIVKFESERNEYSSSMQGLTLALVACWTIIYIIFRKTINSLLSFSTIYMLLMIIIMWSTAIFQFWASEQRVEFKYKKLVIITLIVSILNPVLSIILIKIMPDKVLARILATTILDIIFYFWMAISQINKGKKVYVKKFWIHALSFNIPLIPHYISQTILSSSDRIMISKLIDAESAGIYSLAYSLSLVMSILNNSLMQTISPWMYKKIKDNKIKDISATAYISLFFIALCNLALIILAPEIVSFFAPSDYYEAIWIIPPVAMSVYFMYLYDLFAKFEFYYEKTKLISLATVIGAVTNIVLNYIFITKYGYIAAGYTTLICYVLYAMFHYIAMNKVCREFSNGVKPYDLKILLSITASFSVLSFIFLYLYEFSIIRYIIFIVILLTFYFNKNKITILLKDKK